MKLPKTEAYQQSRKLSHELVISIKTSTSNPDTYYNFFWSKKVFMYVEHFNGFCSSGFLYVLLSSMVTICFFCFFFCRNLTFLPQLPRQYYTPGVCALKIWEHLRYQICHNFSIKNNNLYCVIFLFTNLRPIAIRICQLNLLMIVFKTFWTSAQWHKQWN